MPKAGSYKDLKGKKFGKLTVVKKSGWYRKPGSSRGARWRCLCDCGKSVTVTGGFLTSGHTASCGCLRTASKKLPLGQFNRQGEIAELSFAVHAVKEGISVGFPHGHCHQFDLIAFDSNKYSSVQVKSTTRKCGPSYYVSIARDKKPYNVDFYACYVVQEDVFYIIPTGVLPNINTIALSSTYKRYRNAWHLLKGVRHASD